MTKDNLLDACNYSKKFFRGNYFKSEPRHNNVNQLIVSLPFSHISPSGTKYDTTEFAFEFDERAKRFYFWSYYIEDKIRLSGA